MSTEPTMHNGSKVERSLDARISRQEQKLVTMRRRQAMRNARLSPDLRKLATARNALAFYLKHTTDEVRNRPLVAALEIIEKRILAEKPAAGGVLPFPAELHAS